MRRAFAAGAVSALLVAKLFGWWWALLVTPAAVYVSVAAAVAVGFAVSYVFDTIAGTRQRA